MNKFDLQASASVGSGCDYLFKAKALETADTPAMVGSANALCRRLGAGVVLDSESGVSSTTVGAESIADPIDTPLL
jgi:hypothetical protein